jgi:PAS domain S-box-containing protein
MFVAWGAERTMLYNDGYAPMCGAKHPSALGRPFAEVWADILHDVGPIMDRAYAGEPSRMDDLVLVMLDRHGYPEEAHFSFSYTPVRDETGEVAGVFCACSETTDKVLADRRLAFQLALGDRLRDVTDPVAATMVAAEALGRHLGVARAGYGEIDEAQAVVSVARDWTDGTVPSLAGEARILDAFGPAVIAELRAGRTLRVQDCLTDPRAGEAHAATWASIGCRALIVVPLVKAGWFRAILYLHEPAPRRWTDAEASLADDVAERTWDTVERVRAEARLRASEEQLRSLADTLPVLVSFVDRDERYGFVNRIYEDWFGQPREVILGRTIREVIGEEGYALRRARIRAALGGERQRFQAFTPRADGTRRDTELDYLPRIGSTGAVDGFFVLARDVTERNRAEAALRESEVRFRLAARAVQGIVYDLDLVNGTIWRSDGLERVIGIRHEAAPATAAWWQARVHPEDAALVVQRTRELQDAATRHLDTEYRVRHADGHWVYLHDRSFVLRDGAGRALRLIGVSTDITARKRAEQHQRLLLQELSHRVKNTLAVVQSIAARSLSGERTLEEAREAFAKRLRSLANAHSLLTASEWREAGLRAVVEIVELKPYANQAAVTGPDVALAPKAALTLALVVHELATNAVKHGALATGEGRLEVGWELAGPPGRPAALRLTWVEHDGPPVQASLRRGFGRTLIEQGMKHDLGGEVALAFLSEGLRCELVVPATAAVAGG